MIIFFVFFFGGGIGWRIFKCYQKKQRRERFQQRMNNLIDIHKKLLQISAINQSNITNETDVRYRKFLSL